MIKLTETNGALTIQLPSVSSNRQRFTVQQIVKSGDLSKLVNYLSSFKGHRKHIDINRNETHGIDVLANKDNGSVKRIFDRMLDTSRNHSPMGTNTDWIGVEIECMIPYDSVGTATLRECFDCEGSGNSGEVIESDEDGDVYGTCERCEGEGTIVPRQCEETARENLREMFLNESIKFASLKDDGSISAETGFFPIEITVLTRLSQPENLKRTCKLLNSLGARVNKSCGMHVHLDMRHKTSLEVKQIGTKFSKVLPVLLAMVPSTRRNNTYCRPSVSKLNGTRYHAVNLTAFNKYRTVEVRLHSSTTDFNKIISWSRLLSAIATSDVRRRCTTINELTEYVSIDENLVEYMTQRTELFTPSEMRENYTGTAIQFQDSDSTERIGA